MTAPMLGRTTFPTSRLLDFCSRKALIAQTGHREDQWPLVALKELVDNALDACEDATVAPVISVIVDLDGIEVANNGPGIPVETLDGALDFSVRVSNREMYMNKPVPYRARGVRAGIAPATYYRCLRDPRPPYAAFRAALDMADVDCEVMVTGNLVRLSRTSTRAAAFLLERRWPERWARLRPLPREAPADTPTAPPPPQHIEARTFSIPELVASLRAQATPPRKGDGEL